MGNRKLPFGYQMRMGEIIRNEPEAKAVQDIFPHAVNPSSITIARNTQISFFIFVFILLL